jgi:hypothetical protein
MEGGVLGAIDLPPAAKTRHFAASPAANDEAPADAVHLGRNLWAVAGRVMVAGLVALVLILIANFGIDRYQLHQIQQQQERLAALEELATSTLRGEIASVSRLGDGHYRVEIYLENTGGADKPIYIMSPTVQAFVQVGLDWQEVTLTPKSDATASVLKVVGRQTYRYLLQARLDKFTQLLPHYMHVRFVNTMLISPESTPKDDLFHRNDSYYIYLRPDDIDDATIAKSVKFAGRRRRGSGCRPIDARTGDNLMTPWGAIHVFHDRSGRGVEAGVPLSVRVRPGAMGLPALGVMLPVLVLLLAGLGVAALLNSTASIMLKGAVALGFFIWVGSTVPKRSDRAGVLRSSAGRIGFGLVTEVARKPLLTLLVILALGCIGTASSIVLMLSVLAVMSVSIAVRRLAWGIVRMGIPQRSQRRNLVAERESHARAVRASRSWQRQIREPRLIMSGPELPGDIDPSHFASLFGCRIPPTRTGPRHYRYRLCLPCGRRWAHRRQSGCDAAHPTEGVCSRSGST